VSKHGVGQWQEIRRDSQFAILSDREAMQLKDKYRNMVRFAHKLPQVGKPRFKRCCKTRNDRRAAAMQIAWVDLQLAAEAKVQEAERQRSKANVAAALAALEVAQLDKAEQDEAWAETLLQSDVEDEVSPRRAALAVLLAAAQQRRDVAAAWASEATAMEATARQAPVRCPEARNVTVKRSARIAARATAPHKRHRSEEEESTEDDNTDNDATSAPGSHARPLEDRRYGIHDERRYASFVVRSNRMRY
jgi:hypothetical protein